MPTTWPTTPSSCCSGGTRCPARPWRRNLRSRGSRTARAAPRSTGWGASWRRASSSGIGAACTVGRGASPSISDRRPDARRPAAHVLQRALWRLVLSPLLTSTRGGAVSVPAVLRPGNAVRRRDPRAAVSAAPAAAGGVSAGAVSRSARRGLRPRRSSISWMPPARLPMAAVLQRHAESAMQVARAQSEVGGETAHVYPTPATPPARGTTSS